MSYILPAILAGLFHIFLAYCFHYSQVAKLDESRAMPRHIQAELFDIKSISSAVKKEETKANAAQLAKEETTAKVEEKPDLKEPEPPAKPNESVVDEQRAALEEAKKQRELVKQQQAQERQEAQEKLEKELAAKEAAAKKQREIESKRKLAAEKEIEKEKQKKEQERKKAQEKKEQQALAAKKKAAAEKKRKEAAAAKKKAQDKKRQAEEKKRLKALEQQIAEEEQFAAEQIAKQMASGIDVYIKRMLKGNFRIPSTARNGIKALVRINLITSGKVVNVEIVESSGNSAFDKAAEQAIWRTESFPKVADVARASPSYFNRELRTVLISFKPEDLRW